MQLPDDRRRHFGFQNTQFFAETGISFNIRRPKIEAVTKRTHGSWATTGTTARYMSYETRETRESCAKHPKPTAISKKAAPLLKYYIFLKFHTF